MNPTSTVLHGMLAGVPIGSWRIDPAHTAATFAVRHLMSKVRGRFADLDGRIVIGETPASCSVEASIATASLDTGTPMRDDDLRSANFFDCARFPSMRFTSTEVTAGDATMSLIGDLTIRDTTRRVAIEVGFLGFDETGLQGSHGSGSRVARRYAAPTSGSATHRSRAARSSSATA